ncbi:MAG: hypothetical protein ABIK37_00640 [candidate division WOR-3 bacterium]
MADVETPERQDSGRPEPDGLGQPAEPKLPEPELVARVVQRLINHMGVRGRVEVTRQADGYFADIRSRQPSGILIGRRGATLRALQHIARAIVRRDYPDVPPVIVDVGGYRRRRDDFLRKKAIAVAHIVLETQREMALDTLTEKEMHFVRDALASLPGVRVYAVGTGPRRTVVVAPVQNN